MKNLKKNILYNNVLWLAVITLLVFTVSPYLSIIYMFYYLIIYYPYKVVKDQKKVQDEMVKFGNYLLSDQRRMMHNGDEIKEVKDSDLKRYKFHHTNEDK